MWHLVWKMFSPYTLSSSLTCILRALLATNNSPWAACFSSSTSSNGSIDLMSSSSSDSISQLSRNIITLLFGHWLDMWPRPWHLKHLISWFQAMEESNLPWFPWLVTSHFCSILGLAVAFFYFFFTKFGLHDDPELGFVVYCYPSFWVGSQFW